jgi:hypothetical protein
MHLETRAAGGYWLGHIVVPPIGLQIPLAIKKNEFMKFLAKWMDLEGIILSEVSLYFVTFILDF